MNVTILPAGWIICELCERMVPRLIITRHHLTPRSRPERIDRKGDIAKVCVTCHLAIHRSFSNKELGARFYTIKKLQASNRLQGYLEWVRKQEVNEDAQWPAQDDKRDPPLATPPPRAPEPLRFRPFEAIMLWESEEQ
jgi:5-methylcytosine-specific restriction protein A